jgi:hypothetical protein
MFANDITNEAVVKFQNDWIDINDMWIMYVNYVCELCV